ncbi:nucleoside deaminase [Lactobacillus sp. Sy-1]|uniref:nucleoside deaminase n=1 Tax=Lactobacillus sp. Sy-1 TaxID=2109645 RepID=UPI001C5B8EA6|nr:nucleoside deaminase [Lactobacillus sp. Sy-1]MBW1605987.1 nucleoside deaminase [Lactobacillus sp. Sy-1]
MDSQQIDDGMRQALFQAQIAYRIHEVPIGAVVIQNGRVIGTGYNLRELSEDATGHAEIFAIQEACRAIGSWRLEDCDLYVTVEPCLMCAGAILNARIKNLYYGSVNQKGGVVNSLYQVLNDQRFNHQVNVTGGVLAAESKQIMQSFFKAARRRKKLARRSGQAK